MTESDNQPTAAQTYGAVDLSSVPAPEEPQPARGGDPLVIDVTEATFESVMETSLRVPVIVDMWASWCEPCKQLGPILEQVVRDQAGRLQLAKIDIDANPQIAQAFQVQTVPTVIALVGGRPIPLFQGAQGKAEVAQIVAQVLQAAAQMGIAGRLDVTDRQPEEVSEEQQAIDDAVAAADFELAEALLSKALANDPAHRIEHARRLSEVQLQARLHAQATTDVSDPYALADQFMSHGNEADAYRVLLDAFAAASGEDRDQIRGRLVDLLRVGSDEDAIRQARSRLSSLLF